MNKKKHKIATLVSALVLTANFIPGCWYYSFSGQGIPGVESIAIPLFKDSSPAQELQLKETLHSQLLEEFQKENILKIDTPENADAVLYGAIISVSDPPAAVNKDEKTEESEVHVVVEIKLDNRATGKTIISERITGIGFYRSIAEREQALEEAVQQLKKDITMRILSGW